MARRGGGRPRWWRWALGGALATALLVTVALVAFGPMGSGLRTLPRWEPGQAYRYQLDYRATERVALLGDPAAAGGRADVEGRFEVAATLVLGALGAEPGGSLLALTLEAPTAARFEFMGQPLVSEAEARAQLAAGEALLVLAPGGQVESVRFAPGAPVLFRRTVLTVLSELRLDLRAGQAAWQVAEAGQRGAGQAAWSARRGLTADLATKLKAPYGRLHAVPEGLAGLAQDLDARVEAEVTVRGRLRRVASSERLGLRTAAQTTRLAAEVSCSLLLSGERPLDAPGGLQALRDRALERLAGAEPARLEDPSPSGETRRALEEQVAGGVDLAVLMGRLDGLAAGQALPADFMWRGGTWLRLHPEACAALAARFREAGTTPRVRRALVSLLVQAASAEAQATLRELLSAATSRAQEGWPRLLTQLTFLETPEPATLELLAGVAGADGPGRTAATMALGAAIGRARGEEAAAVAAELDRRLGAELAASTDPARQAVLLASLANAGRPDDVPVVLPFAAAPSAQVRIAAADALGRAPTPDGVAALERLVVDGELPVQGAAIAALARHAPGEQGLERLAALVRGGAVHELSFPALLNLAAASRAAGAPPPAVRALLAAMSAAPIGRPEIRRLVDDALAAAP